MPHMDITITLLTLAAAVILLAGNFLRNDIVAVLIILTLMITGVLETTEALSGFSSTAVIIVSCMFIIGKAITNTGVAQKIGENIIKYGGTDEKKLLTMIMVGAASIGAFMSSTATAAIFIPIALSVAEKAHLHHKRLLMPLATAALISGMMTLVATTPNIIINSTLRSLNLPVLSFFSFTPFGVIILILAIIFMITIGQNLLAPQGSKVERKKEPGIDDLLQYHQIDKYEYLLRVPMNSDLVDRSIAQMQLSALHHVMLLAIESDTGRKREILPARPEMIFHAEDLLMVIGTPEYVEAFAERFSLHKITASTVLRRAFFQVVGIAEVMLNPNSTLIGKSLREALFNSAFQVIVLGIRRKGTTLTDDIADTPLKFGDILLVCGSWKEILRLEQHRDQYLLLTLPQDHKEVIPYRHKQKTALTIMACMIGLITFDIFPPVTAILGAAAALLLTRCIKLSSIYDVIDWQTVIMIAGILPLAFALQKTGVTAIAAKYLIAWFAGISPLIILACLYITTALFGMFLAGTATAVLIGPMAIDISLKLGISPQACAMTVAIACSAAFISPFGSPVSLLVKGPGGYTFKDYLITGIPVFMLSLIATIGLCWLIYLR